MGGIEFMKGFYIYENDAFPKRTDCLSLHDVSHVCKLTGWDDPEVTIDGGITKKTYTKCSSKDKYDFEIGALISLMWMCGKEKVEKAYRETFFKGGDPGACPYFGFCKEPTIRRLESEVEQLKLDCEKLQKGYNKKVLNGKYGLGVLHQFIKKQEYKKLTPRQIFWRDLLDFDDSKSQEKWVRVPVWAIDEFERFYKMLNADKHGLFFEKKVIWDAIKAKKLNHIYIRVTNWDKYLVWCDEKPYEGCLWSSYIPINTARMFKRRKYYLRVFKDDWNEFRNWCIKSVGISSEKIPIDFPGDSFMTFRYNKTFNIVTGNALLERIYLSGDTPIYSWKDMK